MEDYLLRYIKWHYRRHPYKLIFVSLSVVVVLVALLIFLPVWAKRSEYVIAQTISDVYINLLASVLAFFVAYILVMAISRALQRDEDSLKVSYRNSDMWTQYGTEYLHQFDLKQVGGRSSVFTVYCAKLFEKSESKKLVINDHPNDYFELDTFIKSQYFNLQEAHAKSKSIHSLTVRLRNFEAPTPENGLTAVMETERSTYLAHLLTNRALDYPIKPDVTIRHIYENSNQLYSLRRSKMSNHIGVNALVFLPKGDNKRGYLILPKRGDNATVAKNGVTASVAIRLKMDSFKNKYEDYLTEDYVKNGCVKENLASSIGISQKSIDDKNVEIEFLGLCRDIYEGGKPTLFYVVYLNMTCEEYVVQNTLFLENRNKARSKRKKTKEGFVPLSADSMDEVEEYYLADWQTVGMESCKEGVLVGSGDSLAYNKSADNLRLEFKAWTPKQNKKQSNKMAEKMQQVAQRLQLTSEKHRFSFEQNLISNFWFLTGCEELQINKINNNN